MPAAAPFPLRRGGRPMPEREHVDPEAPRRVEQIIEIQQETAGIRPCDDEDED